MVRTKTSIKRSEGRKCNDKLTSEIVSNLKITSSILGGVREPRFSKAVQASAFKPLRPRKKMQVEYSTIFPLEVWAIIFEELNAKSKNSLRRVCRSFWQFFPLPFCHVFIPSPQVYLNFVEIDDRLRDIHYREISVEFAIFPTSPTRVVLERCLGVWNLMPVSRTLQQLEIKDTMVIPLDLTKFPKLRVLTVYGMQISSIVIQPIPSKVQICWHPLPARLGFRPRSIKSKAIPMTVS